MASTDGSDRKVLSLLSVGAVLVVCILLGYLLGALADENLGTGPWGILVGVLIGSAAGFLAFFRATLK